MKNEPTKAEFTAIIMSLIYFTTRMDKFCAHCHKKVLDEAIEILRYYYQFAPKND